MLEDETSPSATLAEAHVQRILQLRHRIAELLLHLFAAHVGVVDVLQAAGRPAHRQATSNSGLSSSNKTITRLPITSKLNSE